MSFSVLSLNTGKTRKFTLDDNRSMVSAIDKVPTTGPVYLGAEGFAGDECADRRYHGGSDKAVCVYSADHYPFWEKFLLKPLTPGAFGENLTIRGLDEVSVCLGDIYRIGATELQVSQPRIPRQKINKKFGRNAVVREVKTSGKSGFYLRVLKTGSVSPGDSVFLLNRPDDAISIAESNRLWRGEETPPEFLESVLAKEFVAAAWKKDLQKL